MGWQVIKQPDGLYAIWSTVVDAIIMYDATESEVIQEFVEDARRSAQKSIERIMSELKALPDGVRMFGRWNLWDDVKDSINQETTEEVTE